MDTQRFTLLREYGDPLVAEMDRQDLENEGIECWLKDLNTTSIIPHYAVAIPIKLMVATESAEIAHKILVERDQNTPDIEDAWRMNENGELMPLEEEEENSQIQAIEYVTCPNCQSKKVIETHIDSFEGRKGVVEKLWGYFASAVSGEKYQCLDCKTVWKA